MSDLLARLRIEASAPTVPAVAGQVEKAMDGVGRSTQRAGAAMAGADVQATRLAGGLDRAGDQAQRLDSRLRGSASGAALLGGALGAAGVGTFVSDITRATFAAGGLELGIGAVTEGAGQARVELAFVRQEAQRLGLVAQTTARDFLSLAGATNETALEGEKTRQIWLATAEAGMTLGRTPEQVGRGLEALSQIASKGVVSMEEVRQQLAEAIPGAVQIAARALDMTPAAFSKLVESGKLTSDEFLPKFAAQLREEFGPAIEEYLNSPLGKARVAMGQFQTTLNDLKADAGEGFLDGMTEGLVRLNDQLGDGSTATSAREIGQALGEGAAFAADALVLVVDHLDEITLAAQVVAGVGLVRFLTSTAVAAQQAAAAYLIKAGAARTSALTAQQGLATETAALTGVRGALAQAAAAEVAAAQAVRAGAIARELAAKAAYDQARADLANVSSSSTLAQRRSALAAAEAELTIARNASAAAAGRVAAAEAGQAASMTRLGQAAGVAKGGMSALLGLVGGPWGAAFLAAGGAVWAVTDALEDLKKRTAEAEANTRSHSKAMDEAGSFLEEAALQAAQFGDNNDGAVGGTDALSGATARLAEQTWALANARAEANRQGLMADYNTLKAERDKLQPNWFQRGLQTAAQGVPQGRGGAVADGLAAVFAPDTSARTGEIQRQMDENALRQIQLTFATASSIPEVQDSGSSGAGGSGGSGRDAAANLVADLTAERDAIASHSAAVMVGEAALDAWRIAQAGADAVARAGSDSVRALAEEVERLAIADERIEQAAGFARSADRDTEALKRRAAAAMAGTPAMEALRVSEAGLAQLTAARIASLDELTGAERTTVALAVASAEAKERQAIATEKAEAAGQTIEQLNESIAAEERRQASIGRGIAAEVAYARAEYIRQEVERAGLKVTDAAAQAIMDKADALFTLSAANDNRQTADEAERELRMLRLTNRERELAVRAERIINDLLRERPELTEAEAKAIAERRSQLELEADERARAIGELKTGIRDAFIKDGKLGIDQLADYALEQLRASIYDAFLAEPIDIVVNATVDIVNDLAKQIFGGSSAQGFLSSIFGAAGGFGKVMGNAGVGGAIGTSMGLGSGNGLLDAGLSIGGSYLGGVVGAGMTTFASLSSALGGSMLGTVAGILGPVMGPLGALAGVALGSLLKDEKRPYTRADIVAQDGRFVVAGTQGVDGGDTALADQLGKAITESLNASAKLFGIDVSKLEGLYTTAGYVSGGNYKALGGEGFFGGDINGAIDYFNQAGNDLKGNTLGAGVSTTQVGTAEELATAVVRETILRAIAAGATDLSESEQALVKASASLEEAITLIQTARGFGDTIDDMLLELLDPAAFERQKALAAVEATYEALKAQANELIDAGLLGAEALDKIEQLHALQRQAALDGLSEGGAGNPFAAVRDTLQGWLDGLAVSDLAVGGVQAQRTSAMEQYQRVLALAQAGDQNALSDITGYADRLLRADRSATGSASSRAALTAQVTADIEGLVGRGDADQPAWANALLGELGTLLRDPDWADELERAIGDGLTGSIDDLGDVLARLAEVLGGTVPTADVQTDMSPFIMPLEPANDFGTVVVTVPDVPILTGGPGDVVGGGGGTDTSTVDAVDVLGRRLEAQLKSVQSAFEAGLADLVDLTEEAADRQVGALRDQIGELKDLGSAQRMTAAVARMRTAA